MQCQRWFADGYVLEESVQSCQTVVSCPGTVAASSSRCSRNFPKKGASRSSIRSSEGARREALGCELEQQAKGVPVGRYGVRTRAKLFLQSIGKEALNERLKAGNAHRSPPSCASAKRSVASWRSSGTASRYQ